MVLENKAEIGKHEAVFVLYLKGNIILGIPLHGRQCNKNYNSDTTKLIATAVRCIFFGFMRFLFVELCCYCSFFSLYTFDTLALNQLRNHCSD